MKKVMIIGGSGFLGLNLIEKFLDNNYQVIVYDINEPRIKNINIHYIKGDLSKIEEKIEKIKNFDIEQAIYLVNNIAVNNESENFEELINENKKAIDLLYKVVKRIVFFSSGGRVYKNSTVPHKEDEELYPTCQYGKGKALIENYFKELNLKHNKDYLIIRPSNPYGKYQNINGNQGVIAVLIGKIMRNETIEIWGTGKEKRDYIYIKDFTDLFFKVFENKLITDKVINIGTGKSETTLNIIKTICKKLDKNEVKKNYIVPKQKYIKTNILNINKLMEITKDYKYMSLEDGIEEFLSLIKKENK